MRISLATSLRALGLIAGLSILPTAAPAATTVVFGRQEYGPVEVSPASILIAISPLTATRARFHVRQFDYTGPFTGKMFCGLDLFNKPKLDIDGHDGTIFVPKQALTLDVGCSVVVLGGNHKYAVLPVEISVGL